MSQDTITPLDGERGIPALAPRRDNSGTKKVVAAAIMLVSLVAVGGFVFTKFMAGKTPPPPTENQDVASSRVQPLKLGEPPARAASAPAAAPTIVAGAAASPAGVRVPSIEPTGQAEPIPVRGATQTAGRGGATAQRVALRPGDESVFIGDSTSRSVATGQPQGAVAEAQANLKRYESQLGGMLQQLQGVADKASGRGGAMPAPTGEAPTAPNAPLFGTMERSATPRVSARTLGDRSLTMPKGTTFMCALKTKVISATSGFVGCQVQRNVFSDDGKVLLVERGSHLDGEYRIVQVRPGVTRIPVLWTRVRTPQGVTVDLDSPGTGELGESGIGGYVDNRWPERIGAALLLSLIQDSITLAVSDNNPQSSSTVVLPSTQQSSSKLAEKVLESTINIPPLIYQNQGSVVGVYVARDIDFSTVYRLEPR